MPGFDEFLRTVLRLEGGWYPGTDAADPNPTMKGITQRTYDAWRVSHGLPTRTVKNIDDPEVAAIYRHQYWDASGAAALPWPLALVHADAAVNSGVGRAKKFLSFTRDWDTYLKLREAFYRDIAHRNQPMMRYIVSADGSRGGWLRRLDYLRRVATAAV